MTQAQAANGALQQGGSSSGSEKRGIQGERYELGAGAIPQNAGDGIPANAAALHDQEKARRNPRVFCKQIAIVSVSAKTGDFDFKNPRQIP